MSEKRGDLSQVATSTLERLRDAITAGTLSLPLDRSALSAIGIRNQLEAIAASLGGHKGPACLSILDAVLAERAARHPSPELVWTGPEGTSAVARDTAVVLRSLFEGAREHVILAGYSFDHAHDVLAPLHRAMAEHGVSATFFVNIPQTERTLTEPAAYVAEYLGEFMHNNWPFGEPTPRLYYDRRALVPGPPFCSLHAKCVTVDGLRAFVSSANFTQRGQERNIETGVLIEDPNFAGHLTVQWLGLIASGAAVPAP